MSVITDAPELETLTPDLKVSVRDVFGIDSDLVVDAFSTKTDW